MSLPPVGNTIATDFTGIVTGVEVDISFVPCQVIKAMGNEFAFARAGKIMVEHLHGGLGMGIPLAGKVADQFLFLGVDADYGVARRPILGLDFGDVLKRRVPIRRRAQRFFLADLKLP